MKKYTVEFRPHDRNLPNREIDIMASGREEAERMAWEMPEASHPDIWRSFIISEWLKFPAGFKVDCHYYDGDRKLIEDGRAGVALYAQSDEEAMEKFNLLYKGKRFSPPRYFEVDEGGRYTFGEAVSAFMFTGGYLCGSGILDKALGIHGGMKNEG